MFQEVRAGGEELTVGRHCSNCRWWTMVGAENRSDTFGECRYWPPLGELCDMDYKKRKRWRFPLVDGSEWCSGFCRRPKPVPKLRKALVVLETVGCGLEVE